MTTKLTDLASIRRPLSTANDRKFLHNMKEFSLKKLTELKYLALVIVNLQSGL